MNLAKALQMDKYAVRTKYLYYHLLDKIDRNYSLERPRFKSLDISAPVKDRTRSIEFFALKQFNLNNEFIQNDYKRLNLVTEISDKFKTDACFVCHGKLMPVIQIVNYDKEDDFIEMSWCPQCDHSQYSVFPAKEWFSRWYFSHYDSTKELNEELKKRGSTNRYFKKLKPYLGEKKLKILDIGIGYGEKIVPFKDAGYEIYATEATESRYNYVKKFITQNVFLGTFDDPRVKAELIRNAPYDLVFSYHVFEHVYRPKLEMQYLRDLVKPEGLFYLAIPEFYKEGILNNIYQMEHVASYSRNSAKYLMRELGFDPIVAKDDLFQYYSDYCQYLIGKRSDTFTAPIQTGFSRNRITKYLYNSLKLGVLSELESQGFSLHYNAHLPVNYLISEESKAKCNNLSEHLPIRIYHQGFPLFWMAA